MRCKLALNRQKITALMSLLFGLLAQQPGLAGQDTEEIGYDLQYLILGVGLGSTIFYEEGSEGTVQFLQSFVVSQLVTEGLKLSTDKRRPNGNCCNSFPSGHASKSFMGAAFIHRRYGWEYSVPAYIAATFVGYSRVDADKHYAEDVVAGAAIGVLSSFYFTEKYEHVEVMPVLGDDAYGVYVTIEW